MNRSCICILVRPFATSFSPSFLFSSKTGLVALSPLCPLLCTAAFPWPMFTNHRRQAERTGRSGTPRLQYLQELVTEFQKTTDEESKERLVAHLANFAYDPYNYAFLRELNVLELFLDCITESNEKLVEFGVGGICNSCVDPANASIITQCGGISLIIECLSSPVRNTVNYALGSLYYLCNISIKSEILKPEVIEVIRKYADAQNVNASFSNLAIALLEKLDQQ